MVSARRVPFLALPELRQCDGTVLYPKDRYAPKADREETAAPRSTRRPFTMPVRPRGSNARACLSPGTRREICPGTAGTAYG
jgi:hypothetical protein